MINFSLTELQSLLKNKTFLIVLGITILIILIISIILIGKEVTKPPVEPPTEGKIEIPNPPLTKPRVVRVEPLPGQKDVSTAPTIKVFFEEDVSELKVSISPKPPFKFKSAFTRRGSELTLTPTTTLKPSTKYKIDVLIDETIIYFWNFTTKKATVSLSVIEKIKKQMPYQDPGGKFNISYSAATDKFFVRIKAKPIDTSKQAAINWFKSQGLTNPEKQINIVYLTSSEILPPHPMGEQN